MKERNSGLIIKTIGTASVDAMTYVLVAKSGSGDFYYIVSTEAGFEP